MKKILNIIIVAAIVGACFTSCYKAPDYQGYLGDGIYLQGEDTLFVAVGTKAASSVAWLDNSTQPCKFEIINVRDGNDKRVESFFQGFATRLWVSPYDYLTDRTSEDVLAKLTDAMLTPIMINEVNGQIRVMESTSKIGIKAGDVFNVDVRVTNSRGSVDLKDYAVLCFQEGASSTPFVLSEVINGICITNAAGENTFPYYDKLNSDDSNFAQRRDNVYADNGREFVTIHKISNTPEQGIEVHFKLLDKNGNLFDPATYESYSTLTSYIEYGVDRVNSPEDGMVLSFPLTPWPVETSLRAYWKGATYTSFDNLDVASLKADNKAGTIPYNANWPADDYADAKGWFVRIRSMVTFYDSGTWEFICKVPYTSR